MSRSRIKQAAVALLCVCSLVLSGEWARAVRDELVTPVIGLDQGRKALLY
jgi:hypothetical protein